MNDFKKYKLSSDYNAVKTLWKMYAAEKKRIREDTENEKIVQQTIESDMQTQTECYKKSKCHIKSLEKQSFS